MPVEIEEVRHLDGSIRKHDAKASFLQVKEQLLKYGLAKENEFNKIYVNSDNSKRGVKTQLGKCLSMCSSTTFLQVRRNVVTERGGSCTRPK